MSAAPTESAMSMTGISGCGTTSRHTMVDDQQVVIGQVQACWPAQVDLHRAGAGDRSAPGYAPPLRFPVNRSLTASKLPRAISSSAHGDAMRCRPDVIPLCSSCQR